MEIIVLVVIWLLAAFSASEHELGFAVFLVFASLGGIAWRWRGKIDELRKTVERDANATDGLRTEVKNLTQELRLLKAKFESGIQSVPIPTEQGPAAARTTASEVFPKLSPAIPESAQDVPKVVPAQL